MPNDAAPSTPPDGDTPGGGPAHPARGDGRTAPGTAAEVRRGALVLLAVAVTGIALGLLWLRLAPRVPLVWDGRSVLLKESEAEHAVGTDGVFILLGLAFGALAALAVFLRHRQGASPSWSASPSAGCSDPYWAGARARSSAPRTT
ncbi:hypothetical protein [Streptomyces sudanensis]|uniref:hypothetical protein n=1 Tax=Streptomyces sudanensis TaxID=436397 RepID=UPI003557D038